MKDKFSIVVKLDASGETYEYHLQKNGLDVITSDGYESPEDISRDLLEFQEVLNNVDLTLGNKF